MGEGAILAHFNKYSGILHAVLRIRIMFVIAITAAIIIYILELIFPVSLHCLTALFTFYFSVLFSRDIMRIVIFWVSVSVNYSKGSLGVEA